MNITLNRLFLSYLSKNYMRKFILEFNLTLILLFLHISFLLASYNLAKTFILTINFKVNDDYLCFITKYENLLMILS